jgi:hypothetical protein
LEHFPSRVGHSGCGVISMLVHRVHLSVSRFSR